MCLSFLGGIVEEVALPEPSSSLLKHECMFALFESQSRFIAEWKRLTDKSQTDKRTDKQTGRQTNRPAVLHDKCGRPIHGADRRIVARKKVHGQSLLRIIPANDQIP